MKIAIRKMLVVYHEFEPEFDFVEQISPACETCIHKKCCRDFWVPLTPEEAKRLPVDWNGWVPGAAVLAKKENGECIYLNANGQCDIYQNRPVACREYVCIDDERINREAMNMG